MFEDNARTIIATIGGEEIIKNDPSMMRLAFAACQIADKDGLDVAIKWISDNIGNPFL